MESPQVSADRLHGDMESALPVPVKGEEPVEERAESEVRLCVEESSAMTPSDELHSTDSASFPSLTDDIITDGDITDDITTNDVTTNDTTTNDVTTVGVASESEEGEESHSCVSLTVEASDLTGSTAAAPPSSSTTTCPPSSDTPTCAKAPPTSTEAPTPAVSVTPPPAVAEGARSEVQKGAESEVQKGAGSQQEGAGPQEVYLLKWIRWKDKRTPIVTQAQNGPCPLLAIINTLLLRWKVKLPAQTEVVTTEDLMTHLGECVLSVTPREKSKGEELNFQQNMSDAMLVLPKLCTGLDVNVRFTGVSHFEFTPELIVFDLLNIPLYHGWLLDPQSPEMVSAVGNLSYNQLVEKIIDCKHSTDTCKVSEGLIAEQFLESTASQLSYHGLCELTSRVSEGQVCVFFRNNHFSTITKHQSHLYVLVTDQGFQCEERLVWESLHNVEGDGNFCDSDFRLHKDYNRSTAQIDQDFLVAMSLQQTEGAAGGVVGGAAGGAEPLSDAELARQLQQEEYQQQQSTATTTTTTQQTRGSVARRRDRDRDSDCVLL